MPQDNNMAVRELLWTKIFILTAFTLSYMLNYALIMFIRHKLSSLEDLPMKGLKLDRETSDFICGTIISSSLYQIAALSLVIFGNDAIRKTFKKACRLLIICLFVFGFKASRDVRNTYGKHQNELIKVAIFDGENLDELYALQTKLQCCGAENYLDFNMSGTSSCFQNESSICTLPSSCFKAEAFQIPSLEIKYGKHKLTATWKNGNIEKAAEAIYVKGCREAVWETFDSTAYIILVVCVVTAVVQALLFVLINIFLCQLELEEEEDIDYMHQD